MMATSRPYYQPSSPFSLHHSSPLETLGRSTTRQNIPPPVRLPPAHSSNSSGLNPQFTYPAQSSSSSGNHLTTPPRQQPQQHSGHHLTPSSPLLHSHFSRGSTATRSSKDDNSYLDLSGDSSQVYHDDYHYYDQESIYSSAPAIRDSWESHGTSPHKHLANDYVVDSEIYDAYAADPDSPVPTVFVSPVSDEPSRLVGKAPILRSAVTNNYSRPVRPSLPSEQSPAELEDRKRKVLERNGRSTTSSPTSSYQCPSPSHFPVPPRGLEHFQNNHRSPLPQPGSRSPSPTDTIHGPAAPSTPSPNLLSVHRPEAIALPRKPPSVRVDSPASLYSTYSFYQLDNGSSSPSPSSPHFPPGTQSSQPHFVSQPTSQNQIPPPPHPNVPTTPADYLQFGITHHEANRLTESASCFEKSATVNGGCGVGMLLWGLTLRHGWGCPKNEKTGFSWLRKAAEFALGDLERQQSMNGKEEMKDELVLAIYEVGQCFFHGWGVAKDQKMAVSYYTTAARLGDPDAQSDLAFCLANGKGCKKDRKEAARWYRKAVAQGQSDIGLAWIYKKKFQ
ncbi:HCP-like protein [Guyanagaster necrorhizus]|uniref:HCP-like protein n=1 Tax=Guyanagaster necrorhizus TaxID=856835 RepID=A0A9P8ASB1_9AGAR|nr:HCP-like protein [Guyanagaster necrorhizus MCA 3950]KAG7446104.1 HCP-like protein [Guyanagaster necrorhizus MCA 3950]